VGRLTCWLAGCCGAVGLAASPSSDEKDVCAAVGLAASPSSDEKDVCAAVSVLDFRDGAFDPPQSLTPKLLLSGAEVLAVVSGGGRLSAAEGCWWASGGLLAVMLMDADG
jgi:hypothetical protein